MGTVPTPAQWLNGVAVYQTASDPWWNALGFLLKPPACAVQTSGVIALTAGVALAIPFGAETLDQVQSPDAEMHSTSVNPDRITIRTAGRYDVHVTVQIAATASATAGGLMKNTVVLRSVAVLNSSTQAFISFTETIQCAVGDYLQAQAFSSVAGTLPAAYPSTMYVKWVSN